MPGRKLGTRRTLSPVPGKAPAWKIENRTDQKTDMARQRPGMAKDIMAKGILELTGSSPRTVSRPGRKKPARIS